MRKHRIKSIIIALFIATAVLAPVAYFAGLTQSKVNADQAELEKVQDDTALSNALSEAIKKNALAAANDDCNPDMRETEARARGCLLPLSRSSIREQKFKPLDVAAESLSNEVVSTLAHSGGVGMEGASGSNNSDSSPLDHPLSAAVAPEGGILAGGNFGHNGVSRFIAPGGISVPVDVTPPSSGPKRPGPVKTGPPSGTPTGGPTHPTKPTPPTNDPLPPIATPDPVTPPIVTPLPGAFFLFMSGIFGFFGIAWRPQRR